MVIHIPEHSPSSLVPIIPSLLQKGSKTSTGHSYHRKKNLQVHNLPLCDDPTSMCCYAYEKLD